MNDRKQLVIKMAHQLFIEKGFQASSIQDILDYSGISKGTFYNYFSSKNELLMAIIKSVYQEMEKRNQELLIDQDPSNIDIFEKQLIQQLKINRTNQLFSLFEEVIVSKDAELNHFIKEWQLKFLQWVYQRFLEIFTESKQPYLLDCAIMFIGILQSNLKYYRMAHDSKATLIDVVRYSVDRVKMMVEEVSNAGDHLIMPDFLDRMLPNFQNKNNSLQKQLNRIVTEMKKTIKENKDMANYNDLLDFILDELQLSNEPRKFLIDSSLLSLKTVQSFFAEKNLQELDEIVESFFKQK